MALVATGSVVPRAIHVTALDQVFSVHASLADALGEHGLSAGQPASSATPGQQTVHIGLVGVGREADAQRARVAQAEPPAHSSA